MQPPVAPQRQSDGWGEAEGKMAKRQPGRLSAVGQRRHFGHRVEAGLNLPYHIKWGLR
jgi:hypothetical protein